MTKEEQEADMQEATRLSGLICRWLDTQTGESYENKMRMCMGGILHNAFEPGKGDWLIGEVRELLYNLRAMVMNEPIETGFFTPSELKHFRATGWEVQIITSSRMIQIMKELRPQQDGAIPAHISRVKT